MQRAFFAYRWHEKTCTPVALSSAVKSVNDFSGTVADGINGLLLVKKDTDEVIDTLVLAMPHYDAGSGFVSGRVVDWACFYSDTVETIRNLRKQDTEGIVGIRKFSIGLFASCAPCTLTAEHRDTLAKFRGAERNVYCEQLRKCRK